MFFQKNKKKIILVVAIILLIFFHYINILRPVEDLLYNLLTPISSSIYSAKNSISNKYINFKDRKKIDELYNKCIADNKQIEIYNTKIQILEEENKKLQTIVNFTSNTAKNLITTRAIGKNTDNLSKMIIIDVGKKDGIKVGQAVVASGNILIGTISKIQNNVSFVRLVNDNQSKIAATMLNKDKSLGIVEGGYGLSLRMTLIPREEIIILGNKVITSGLQENIPYGILIGDVAVAENEAYQPFQQAILNPAIDLSKLDIVSVIMQN